MSQKENRILSTFIVGKNITYKVKNIEFVHMVKGSILMELTQFIQVGIKFHLNLDKLY